MQIVYTKSKFPMRTGKEVTLMRANNHVLGKTVPKNPFDWEETRCWAEALLSRQRLNQAVVAAGAFSAVLALVGLVEYSLYQAMQAWSFSGVGPSVFGFF